MSSSHIKSTRITITITITIITISIIISITSIAANGYICYDGSPIGQGKGKRTVDRVRERLAT